MPDDEEFDEIFANRSDDQIIAELHQMQIHAARAKAFGEFLCRFKYLMIIALPSLYVYYFHWSLLFGADTTAASPSDIAAVSYPRSVPTGSETPPDATTVAAVAALGMAVTVAAGVFLVMW